MTTLLRRATLAAASLIAALVWTAPAPAQESANSASFWLQEEARGDHHMRPSGRQTTRVRRLVPNRKLARPTIWRAPERVHEAPAPAATPPAQRAAPEVAARPPETTPAIQQPSATPPAAAAPATADAAVTADAAPTAPAAPVLAGASTVAVVGDNLGYWLAQGLADSQAEPTGEGPRFTVLRKTRDSSGLVRDDFYDWQKNLRELLARGEKLGAVAIMIGSNDRQELRDAGGRHEALTPRWREIYAARIDAFIAQLKDRNIPYFWVGLPIMRAERYSSEIGQLNEIYRARVEAAGGKYVDVWDAFADENGRYSVFGPDVNGQIVKLRTGDGIHFTKAGARKLAYFAEQSMRSLFDRPKPQPDAAVAALPPPGAAPPALVPSPAAPEAPPAPAPPPKPIAGPILPLTAPAIASGGELVGLADPARRAEEARATIAPELAEGRLAPAPRGRADDFTWPRR